jgi:hypothetical protein
VLEQNRKEEQTSDDNNDGNESDDKTGSSENESDGSDLDSNTLPSSSSKIFKGMTAREKNRVTELKKAKYRKEEQVRRERQRAECDDDDSSFAEGK